MGDRLYDKLHSDGGGQVVHNITATWSRCPVPFKDGRRRTLSLG